MLQTACICIYTCSPFDAPETVQEKAPPNKLLIEGQGLQCKPIHFHAGSPTRVITRRTLFPY